MADWTSALPDPSRFIGEPDAAGFEHLHTAVWDIVREDLHHYRSSIQDVVDDPELPDAAKDLYLRLRERPNDRSSSNSERTAPTRGWLSARQ
jgi:hypothetical protein